VNLKQEEEQNMIKAKSARLRVSGALAVILALLVVAFTELPGVQIAYAFNGYLEDCDFDGYDDETGAPVPWYGFDETKGDRVPSDWNGVAGSYSFSNSNPPSSGGTGSGSDSTNSNNGNSAGTGSTGSGAANTNNSNGGGSSGNNSGSSNSSGTQGSSGSSSGGASQNTSGTSANSANAGETASQGDSTASDIDQASLSAQEKAEIDEVVAVKGSLAILPESGETVFYPGGKAVIKGEGFKGDVDDYTVEIHSTVIELATFSTVSDGSFEITVDIPDDIDPGRHNIWILYKGGAIVQKGIDIASGSVPLASKTAGIDEPGLSGAFVGFIILASVIAIGVAATIAWYVTKKRKGEN
jgi:hypothetical protein